MMKNLYIGNRFFIAIGVAVFLFVLAFIWPILQLVAWIVLMSIITLAVIDGLWVYSLKNIEISRSIPSRLDLNEHHEISLMIKNNSGIDLNVEIIDELPVKIQARDIQFSKFAKNNSFNTISYNFHPQKRGTYEWKNIHLIVSTPLAIVQRRIIFDHQYIGKVYPSVLEMRKMEFEVFKHQTLSQGIKKIRRLGHNNEFEQIKNYVQGDDPRTINWKATSRSNELMVNQYQEERSQSIYAILDKSRTMEQSFEGLTFLDFAINSTLAFANIALKKGDKFGCITFESKTDAILPADGKKIQLKKTLELLYNQKSDFLAANYEEIYHTIRKQIPNRSTLLLFTNFETEVDMKRVLPVLRRINKNHNLVVVFFENIHLDHIILKQPENIREVYLQQVADDFVNVQRRISNELRKNGIQTVLSHPEKLSVDTINKYLAMKSGGLV